MDKSILAAGFSLSEAQIGTVQGGEPGLLVWNSDQLVGVLTLIDEESYATKGKWFLEAGFGLLSGQHGNFDTVEEAVHWVAEQILPTPSACPSLAAAASCGTLRD